MKPWEVYEYSFPDPIGKHPVVVISNSRLCEKGNSVNVLMCVTLRGDRQATAVEVVLNGADGLDHKSLVACDVIYLVKKSALNGKPFGSVSTVRRSAIRKTIMTCLGS
ncbi:transcriptional modulator of MazE/toxin, MazF [Chthoniobacter flavus Ellin428]|uniref:Transcriptional modulator of MazE/toxin, MazF n=1 Tax=Chthoniobacter flavus Ellin428 TaxID=497964 RepID=B4D9G0_9BACT|nr:type II toxin-antitoxin system PemK/MazF family toxin [Chthoniobacter flavus]EDY16921.1 transcriptional modulator of MazE/toxin, MazF [Chthoniobacter flavus Ellin428]TCO87801.1 mRNA-degrading endonuclease toxin of MazEF toxin-antitoxin module [Chthoniobacter flavus]